MIILAIVGGLVVVGGALAILKSRSGSPESTFTKLHIKQ